MALTDDDCALLVAARLEGKLFQDERDRYWIGELSGVVVSSAEAAVKALRSGLSNEEMNCYWWKDVDGYRTSKWPRQ
jgi:hypothetical protein